MELSFKYIKRILQNSGYCSRDEDAEIIYTNGTKGDVGLYVKWNVINHYTGEIIQPNILSIVYKREIINDMYWNCFFQPDRKRKLLNIQLNNELDKLNNESR